MTNIVCPQYKCDTLKFTDRLQSKSGGTYDSFERIMIIDLYNCKNPNCRCTTRLISECE